ncbi:MAG TPA: hypothetical protein VKP61_15160 [Candidatus Acidoferrum sp.]|nr:hypothetical protein [Candidatus Acidoferrum sp.]
MKPETADAIEKRELVKKLVERKYGPFPGAGGAGRILFEGSLGDQSLETLRLMEKSAMKEEQRRHERRCDRASH